MPHLRVGFLAGLRAVYICPEFVTGMESSMATMAGYLVLMFAAQFVNYFAWSQLGIIAAIKGAGLLQQLQLNSRHFCLALFYWPR